MANRIVAIIVCRIKAAVSRTISCRILGLLREVPRNQNIICAGGTGLTSPRRRKTNKNNMARETSVAVNASNKASLLLIGAPKELRPVLDGIPVLKLMRYLDRFFVWIRKSAMSICANASSIHGNHRQSSIYKALSFWKRRRRLPGSHRPVESQPPCARSGRLRRMPGP
jgi:hypothetical protein